MYISPLPLAADSDVDKLRDDIANKLLFTIGKDPVIATKRSGLMRRYMRYAIEWSSAGTVLIGHNSLRMRAGLLSVDGIFNWPYAV